MASKRKNMPMFVSRDPAEMTAEYRNWLSDLKQRYRKAQVRAAVKVNGELLNFYWELGRDIYAMSKTAKYGDGLLKNTTLDLQAEFPGDTGLSLSNIKAARRWYKSYYEWVEKSQQPVDFFGSNAKDGSLTMPYFLPMSHGDSISSLRQKQNPCMKRCSTSHKYANTDGAVRSLNIIIPKVIIPVMHRLLRTLINACRRANQISQSKCSKVRIILSFCKCQ